MDDTFINQEVIIQPIFLECFNGIHAIPIKHAKKWITYKLYLDFLFKETRCSSRNCWLRLIITQSYFGIKSLNT